MFAVVVVAKLVYGSYTKTPKGRIWKAKMALTIPLIGPINQMNASVQFANTMSVLLAAGITLDRQLRQQPRSWTTHCSGMRSVP